MIKRHEYESSVKRVQTAWDRLIKHHKSSGMEICCFKGATPEEIEALQTESRLNIPVSLIESLKICNCNSVIGGLYNIRDILEEIHWWKDNVANFYKNMVPIYDWNVVAKIESPDDLNDVPYLALIQMDKNSAFFGKVIYSGYPGPRVWADSYEEWLEQIVDETISKGKVTFEYFDTTVRAKKPMDEYHEQVLKQIFGGTRTCFTRNHSIVSAHDYGIAPERIAAFLGIEVSEVDEIIDLWETKREIPDHALH